MKQTVKRLSGLEIDEVSLVDRPANQHGLVTITKRDGDAGMSGFYNEQGQPLDESTLQSGMQVFDESGEPVVLLSDEHIEELYQAGELTDDDIEGLLDSEGAGERELAEVGKSAAAVTGGASSLFQTGRKVASRKLGEFKQGMQNYDRGPGLHRLGRTNTEFAGAVTRGYRGRIGLAGGAAGGYAVHKAAPSLGEEVLSTLSKALTDGDQHRVIADIAERVEKADRIAKAAEARAAALEAEAERAEYVELAKGLELPVEPDHLGAILQKVSKVLEDTELETFERILYSASEAVAKSLEEVGTVGYSPLMQDVQSGAMELVGKSAGDVTPEQATVALFEANPDAYLDYLSETK